MCFVWISEQTVIISLYNINWLVFITETKHVYGVVWTALCSALKWYLQFDNRLPQGTQYCCFVFRTSAWWLAVSILFVVFLRSCVQMLGHYLRWSHDYFSCGFQVILMILPFDSVQRFATWRHVGRAEVWLHILLSSTLDAVLQGWQPQYPAGIRAPVFGCTVCSVATVLVVLLLCSVGFVKWSVHDNKMCARESV